MNQDMRNFFLAASKMHEKLDRKELRLTLPERKWHMTPKQYIDQIRIETNKIENIPALISQLLRIRMKVNRLTGIANKYLDAVGESQERYLLYENTSRDSIVDELMYGDYTFYTDNYATSNSISDWYDQLIRLIDESKSRIEYFRDEIQSLSKAYSRKVIDTAIENLQSHENLQRVILYSLPYSANNTPEDNYVSDVILELHQKGQFLKIVIYKDNLLRRSAYYNRFIAIPGKTKTVYR